MIPTPNPEEADSLLFGTTDSISEVSLPILMSGNHWFVHNSYPCITLELCGELKSSQYLLLLPHPRNSVSSGLGWDPSNRIFLKNTTVILMCSQCYGLMREQVESLFISGTASESVGTGLGLFEVQGCLGMQPKVVINSFKAKTASEDVLWKS